MIDTTANKLDDQTLKKIQFNLISSLAHQGSVLYHQIKNIVTPDCLINDDGRFYFRVISAMAEVNCDLEEALFQDTAIAEGYGEYYKANKEKIAAVIQKIQENQISANNAIEYARILARRHYKNKTIDGLKTLATQLSELPDNTLSEVTSNHLVEFVRQSSPQEEDDGMTRIGEGIHEYISELLDDEPGQPGLDVGLPLFEEGSGGILPGTVTCVSARMKSGKCVSGNTLVYFTDGSQITIREIVKNRIDKPILTYDENNSCFVSSKIVNYWNTGNKQCVSIITKSGRHIECTLDHKFLTLDGWKPLRDIHVNNIIAGKLCPELEPGTTEGIMWDAIVSIEDVGVKDTYDLEIEAHHNYIANNIITHNSMFAWNIALNVAKQNIPVLYLDMEMTKDTMRNRSLANLSGVTINELKYKTFQEHPDKVDRVKQAGDVFANLPLIWEKASAKNIDQCLAFALRWIARHVGFNDDGGAKKCLLVYDYMKSTDIDASRPQWEILGVMAQKIKDFAHINNVPTIVPAQLSREGLIAGSDQISRYFDTIWSVRRKKDTQISQDNADAGQPMGNVVMVQEHVRDAETWDKDNDYITLDFISSLCLFVEKGRKVDFAKPKSRTQSQPKHDTVPS